MNFSHQQRAAGPRGSMVRGRDRKPSREHAALCYSLVGSSAGRPPSRRHVVGEWCWGDSPRHNRAEAPLRGNRRGRRKRSKFRCPRQGARDQTVGSNPGDRARGRYRLGPRPVGSTRAQVPSLRGLACARASWPNVQSGHRNGRLFGGPSGAARQRPSVKSATPRSCRPGRPTLVGPLGGKGST